MIKDNEQPKENCPNDFAHKEKRPFKHKDNALLSFFDWFLGNGFEVKKWRLFSGFSVDELYLAKKETAFHHVLTISKNRCKEEVDERDYCPVKVTLRLVEKVCSLGGGPREGKHLSKYEKLQDCFYVLIAKNRYYFGFQNFSSFLGEYIHKIGD